jgi:hypothetical protein
MTNQPAHESLSTFSVKEIFGPNHVVNAVGHQLTSEGMVLHGAAVPPEQHRFLWLEFQLPGQTSHVKALGEVVNREDEQVQVRFKHLFPDHRKQLSEFLLRRTSMN